ncbi:alpha/beta hydrolase [Actinoplanes sp. TRM 88003]|uniref:Alpha/beta hydrolase n=1 Tax=Paractinoplanes aksuensis TaxID=2939490 RepID=A0ABT1DF75_9ACTN|nr:alpha/beta fold hydrolase [Actinoplanes aksuensis]MCO8269476.1 alpha/beta hydrolase [Actinoplanes aksuensis]
MVLLHGVGEDSRMWDGQREVESERFRLLVPDLPGYGRSPGPFSLDAAVESLHASHRGGPVHLYGLSAGAMVALRWAARHPEDVASLIISGVQVYPSRVLLGLQSAVLRLVPARSFDGVAKRTVLEAMTALRRADLRADLTDVRARTLVLCGSKDRFNLSASRAAAEGIPGAVLRMVPDAGHVWNKEYPDLFHRTVLEWTLSFRL